MFMNKLLNLLTFSFIKPINFNAETKNYTAQVTLFLKKYQNLTSGGAEVFVLSILDETQR